MIQNNILTSFDGGFLQDFEYVDNKNYFISIKRNTQNSYASRATNGAFQTLVDITFDPSQASEFICLVGFFAGAEGGCIINKLDEETTVLYDKTELIVKLIATDSTWYPTSLQFKTPSSVTGGTIYLPDVYIIYKK